MGDTKVDVVFHSSHKGQHVNTPRSESAKEIVLVADDDFHLVAFLEHICGWQHRNVIVKHFTWRDRNWQLLGVNRQVWERFLFVQRALSRLEVADRDRLPETIRGNVHQVDHPVRIVDVNGCLQMNGDRPGNLHVLAHGLAGVAQAIDRGIKIGGRLGEAF